MNRKLLTVMIAIVGLLAGANAAAQNSRSHDLIMKDIGPTVGVIREALADNEPEAPADQYSPAEPGAPREIQLDEATATAVVEAAEKLEGLFQELEAWWAPHGSNYTVRLAQTAREGAATVASAVGNNDIERARDGFATLQEACNTCHFSHRVVTDSGFRIRP